MPVTPFPGTYVKIDQSGYRFDLELDNSGPAVMTFLIINDDCLTTMGALYVLYLRSFWYNDGGFMIENIQVGA